MRPSQRKDAVEHRLGQFPGERILLAGMIAADQNAIATQRDRGSVSELRELSRPPVAPAALVEDLPSGELEIEFEHVGVCQHADRLLRSEFLVG